MKIDLMQLEFIDLNLRKIALEVEERFGEKIVTSLYRINDPGVHGQLPLRGLDFRCNTMRHGEEVVKFVHDHWQYDPGRPKIPCCLCHDIGQGLHLHLQTCDKTRRID